MAQRFMDFGLRARKRAQTRVALAEALATGLSTRTLDALPVAELAAAANISQATFFNYFPTKSDLLTHYIQLWSLKMGQIARDHQGGHPLLGLEALFLSTAESLAKHPRVMLEIIAHQARLPVEGHPEVELVERLLFLDDDPDAATLSDQGAGDLIAAGHNAAVKQGFLPPDTDILQATLAVASVFFGVPLLVGHDQPEAIGPLYSQQLRLVWRGLGADIPALDQ